MSNISKLLQSAQGIRQTESTRAQELLAQLEQSRADIKEMLGEAIKIVDEEINKLRDKIEEGSMYCDDSLTKLIGDKE